jgi:hypothetical protein
MFLLLLASILAVAINVALDTCILSHTALAFLLSFFISIAPAIFLVIVLLLIDTRDKGGGVSERGG